jgi:hypothetical protein
MRGRPDVGEEQSKRAAAVTALVTRQLLHDIREDRPAALREIDRCVKDFLDLTKYYVHVG